jgi:MFS family permease
MPQFFNMSGIIVGGGLGTAVTTAVAMNLNSIAGMICGAILGLMAKRIGRFLIPFTICFAALGLLLIGTATSLTAIFLGSLIGGFGYNPISAASLAVVAKYVPPETTAFLAGITLASVNVATSIIPYYLNWLAYISGNTSKQFPLLVGAVVLGIIAVVLFIVNLKKPVGENYLILSKIDD